MIGILQAKWLQFIKKPWLFLIMAAISVMFAYFVGIGGWKKIHIPVYSEFAHEEMVSLLTELNQSDVFEFELKQEDEMKEEVQSGKAQAGVQLDSDEFTIYITQESPNTPLLTQFIESVYRSKKQQEQLLESVSTEEEKKKIKAIWEDASEQPLFEIQQKNFRNEHSKIIDNQLQGVFGFSLFFVIYTIAFNVVRILEEKRDRIWDRMIVSKLAKWEMYVGNLLYSFLMGYVQVALIFLVFRYVVGIHFYGGFGKTMLILIPYVLTIVALCMLIAALAKSIQHYNALIPFASVVLAMIGGAYWPLEIVSSSVMLTVAKFSPILYGMTALKGATIYGYGWLELLQPISILLLMTVMMMGIGINLMERRND